MIRILALMFGPLAAGVFAIAMYSIYGNLNWGSEAEKNLPWFEDVFWIIFLSGIPLVVLHDFVAFVCKKSIEGMPNKDAHRYSSGK